MVTQELRAIASIRSDFHEKFGIPRQSGLIHQMISTVVFEPEYRNPDAFREIEGFSHLWLIWQFSKALREDWSPTVRPPRLGGNTRIGVFASRSPFRPNPLGLSCVKLERYRVDPVLGPVLEISGADLLDGTPIFDVKPYLPYADCRPDAVGGFAADAPEPRLQVEFSDTALHAVPPETMAVLREILALDPRPSYHHDPERIYGMSFAGMEIRFRVVNSTLTVLEAAAR